MKKSFYFLILFTFLSLSIVYAVSINSGTVLNTSSSNSSVTFSFNVNVTNFTIQSSYVLINEINFTNSSGLYLCTDVNYSTLNSNLDSSQFSCTLQGVSNNVQSTSTSGSGGSGSVSEGLKNYIEEKESSQSLKLYTQINSGKSSSIDFEEDKNTGINYLKIKAKSDLEGDIEIFNLLQKPENCELPQLENYVIYKVLEMNHSFENNEIEELEINFFIEEKWMTDNEIINISSYRCYPEINYLQTELIDENNYKIYANGFSIWVIGGFNNITKEDTFVEEINETEIFEGPEIEESIEYKNKTDDFYWIFSIIFIILLVLLFIFVFKKRKKKRKIKSVK